MALSESTLSGDSGGLGIAREGGLPMLQTTGTRHHTHQACDHSITDPNSEHNTDSVSTEELEAGNDLLFDHIAAQLQTHISTTVMQ